LTEEGKVSFSAASSRILPELILDKTADAEQTAGALNLIQESNSDEIEAWVQQAINKMPDKVIEYKKGKKGLIGLFVGEVKKASKGKADPKMVTALLEEKLNR
jgi:aspartyl-tRNA(Asn)/glutamyl-tRNA(Gln) amidotransferase subunit B